MGIKCLIFGLVVTQMSITGLSKYLNAQQSSNENTMSDILFIYTTDCFITVLHLIAEPNDLDCSLDYMVLVINGVRDSSQVITSISTDLRQPMHAILDMHVLYYYIREYVYLLGHSTSKSTRKWFSTPTISDGSENVSVISNRYD
jgi:hypothetical protein